MRSSLATRYKSGHFRFSEPAVIGPLVDGNIVAHAPRRQPFWNGLPNRLHGPAMPEVVELPARVATLQHLAALQPGATTSGGLTRYGHQQIHRQRGVLRQPIGLSFQPVPSPDGCSGTHLAKPVILLKAQPQWPR